MKRSSGTGEPKLVPVAAQNESRDSSPSYSAMQVAVQLERSSRPDGMLFCQNDIGSPKIRTSTPARRRCAAAASPYGPAPMMATLTSVTVRPPAASRRSRKPVGGRQPAVLQLTRAATVGFPHDVDELGTPYLLE